MAELEITTVSVKGQVVIPQALREQLRLKPKTGLLVYGEGDTIIMKRLYLPDISGEWKRIKQIMQERNKKYNPLTKDDVKREVKAYRRENYER